jgi:hypothetical protein
VALLVAGALASAIGIQNKKRRGDAGMGDADTAAA